MNRVVRGTVINIHQHGATVRLEDGVLAAVSAAELASNRPAYVSAREQRTTLDFAVDRHGRHPSAALARDAGVVSRAPTPAPRLVDPAFELRMGAYLKETEAWAPPDRPAPSERHFIRKKRRAALFEARKRPT